MNIMVKKILIDANIQFGSKRKVNKVIDSEASLLSSQNIEKKQKRKYKNWRKSASNKGKTYPILVIILCNTIKSLSRC